MSAIASALSKMARTLPRPEFIGKVKSCYLVVEQAAGSEDLAFHTDLIDLDKVDGGGRAAPNVEMHEIVKAPGNPYPDRISVGRARNCDIVMREASVSKLHAHFRPTADGTLELGDLESHNGTRVAGRRLVPREWVVVKPGETVQFGSVVARVMDGGQIYLLR